MKDQVACSVLRELAVTPRLPQSELERRIGAGRETLSRRLGQIEDLGLVRRLSPEGGDRRLNLWRSSFTGLITVHAWLAAEDPRHPGIEEVAEVHSGDWLVYSRYGFLKENPDALQIVNSNVHIHHPFVAWRTPEGFARTYEAAAESVRGAKDRPSEQLREAMVGSGLEPEQVLINTFTRKVLGWDQFIETIVHSQWMLAFMLYLLRDNEIRAFFSGQFLVEDRRHALIQQFREQYFPETVTRL